MASNPITWQNVRGPSLAEAVRPLEAAQNGFSSMFGSFEDILKQRQATETANWDQTKQNNTNALLGAVQEAKNPEEFAAREAALRQQLMGYGAQVDATAGRNALDGRLSTLQQRATTSQQYADQQTDIAGRPIAAGYQSALAQATTPDAVRSLMESIQTATGAGAVDPRLAAALTEKALGRSGALTTESRAAQDHTWKGENYTKTWEHQAEQDRIARAKLVIDRANAVEQRKAREASTNNAGINARSALLNNMGDLVKAQTAAVQEVKKNTPYAEMFGGSNIDLINKAASAANDADPKYGNAVVDKITTLRKTMPDIPVDVITSAISMAKNEFGASLWRSDGYSNSVIDHIKTQMKDPVVMGRVAFAGEQLAKAQGTYNGSTLDPKPEPPKPAPQPLPPQLTFNPPKESAGGSLTYEKPGSFNISSNKGIMTPAKMPTGSMDVTIKDGDTIGVKGANGVTMDFRFNGLDAQETGKSSNGKTSQGQKYSEEAKAFISNAFKSGKVDIRVASNKPDAYGRLVADVYVGGQNLNEALLRKGFATVMAVQGGMGPSQKAAFDLNSRLAMANNAGIMGDLDSDRTPTGSAYRMFGDTIYK